MDDRSCLASRSSGKITKHNKKTAVGFEKEVGRGGREYEGIHKFSQYSSQLTFWARGNGNVMHYYTLGMLDARPGEGGKKRRI